MNIKIKSKPFPKKKMLLLISFIKHPHSLRSLSSLNLLHYMVYYKGLPCTINFIPLINV